MHCFSYLEEGRQNTWMGFFRKQRSGFLKTVVLTYHTLNVLNVMGAATGPGYKYFELFDLIGLLRITYY